MRIAIVDDELSQRQALEAMLRTCLAQLGIEISFIDAYPSAESFLHAFQPGGYDVILLDIYMDKENGVDLARKIRQSDNDCTLAFCTSSNEFAAESYEVGAAYYLQKPFSEEKIQFMLRRLDLARIQRNRTIRLPDGSKCMVRQVMFTEYSNHTVTFHIKNGSSPSVYMNHSEAEALLLHYKMFCCINKGSIVNFSHVKKLTATECVMTDGTLLPISRRRYKEVSAAYTQYHFERLEEEVAL